MIHYHGTPVGGQRRDVVRFLSGRHAFVSFARPEDIEAAAEVCQSFALDNGAFSVWRKGGELDVDGYIKWAGHWSKHPGFDFAVIPDSIDGGEAENDLLLREWDDDIPGVPVWHLGESLGRLRRLCNCFGRVALGSSGAWSTPGTPEWWWRISDAMRTITDPTGRPICKLHGLRMLNPEIFSRIPLASADSTNAVMNSGSLSRFGIYKPPSTWQRAEVIAERIESHNSAPLWDRDMMISPVNLFMGQEAGE